MSDSSTPGEGGTPHLGATIAGYKLLKLLGEGGLAWVYKGRHRVLGRLAAVKVLRPAFSEDEQHVQRFFHEAKVVNSIRHPNIVDVLEFVRSREKRVVAHVMEFLSGPALDRILAKRAMTPRQATNVCLQVIHGLQAAHDAVVIHRDLKPGNLMIVPGDSFDLSHKPSVKILDFGIAKIADAHGYKTDTGLVLGTPAYMAPEQIAGKEVTTAADVYALGQIYFEMVTGRRLFSDGAAAVLRSKLLGEVPPIEVPNEIPGAELIRKFTKDCIAPAPTDRATMKECWTALGAILELQPVPPPRPARPPRDSWTPGPILRSSSSGSDPVAASVVSPQTEQSDGHSVGFDTLVSSGLVRRPTRHWAWMLGGVGMLAAVGLVVYLGEPEVRVEPALDVQIPDSTREVTVDSRPMARVTDRTSGRFLGTTPLAVAVNSNKPRTLRVEARGYRTVEILITTDRPAYVVELAKMEPVVEGRPTKARDAHEPTSSEIPEW